jgi:hypothetical protein
MIYVVLRGQDAVLSFVARLGLQRRRFRKLCAVICVDLHFS